jgi:hypothetical protein
MKTIYVIISVLLFIAFISCDKIDKADIIKSKTINPVDSALNDTIGFPDSTASIVLLEDYTGHTCGNCPKAHEKAQELYIKYPGKVVILSVHCSSFANFFPPAAPKYTYNFKTPEGTSLDNYFGCSLGTGLPKGMVNRVRDVASLATPLDFGAWESVILKASAKKSIIKVETKASLNQDSSNISISTKVKYLQAISDTLMLSVYLSEDSITAWQTDYSKPIGSQDVQFYTHRHVLRKSVTNAFGDLLSNTAKVRKDSIEKTFNIPVDPKWNKKRLSIIAFVSKDSKNKLVDDKVIQTNEVKIK